MRKSGERFWARVVVTALYDAEGHMRGFAKVTQDLTERRHMQDLEKAAKNISDFIACVTYGIVIGAILGPTATRLLYAAQVAGSILKGKKTK